MNSSICGTYDAESRTITLPDRQKKTKSKKPPAEPATESPYSCQFASPNPVVDRFACAESMRRDGLADQKWFKKYPRETVRMRHATRLERAAYGFKGRVMVFVTLLGPGSHYRFYMTRDSFSDPSESRAPTS